MQYRLGLLLDLMCSCYIMKWRYYFFYLLLKTFPNMLTECLESIDEASFAEDLSTDLCVLGVHR